MVQDDFQVLCVGFVMNLGIHRESKKPINLLQLLFRIFKLCEVNLVKAGKNL